MTGINTFILKATKSSVSDFFLHRKRIVSLHWPEEPRFLHSELQTVPCHSRRKASFRRAIRLNRVVRRRPGVAWQESHAHRNTSGGRNGQISAKRLMDGACRRQNSGHNLPWASTDPPDAAVPIPLTGILGPAGDLASST